MTIVDHEDGGGIPHLLVKSTNHLHFPLEQNEYSFLLNFQSSNSKQTIDIDVS